MMLGPLRTAGGPTSRRVPLDPGKPELASWTTSSWRLGDEAGNPATELLVIGPPGRRLGALVEGLPHCPDGTWKTTRSANSCTNWAPTCLWHAGVDVHGRCGLQPLAPLDGRGTLGGGCGGSGTQRPRGDVLVGMYDGWEPRGVLTDPPPTCRLVVEGSQASRRWFGDLPAPRLDCLGWLSGSNDDRRRSWTLPGSCCCWCGGDARCRAGPPLPLGD
jgi:hypothetical protein